MYVFLDFEASSLGKHSYPIEVAWVFEDGRREAHLLRPAEGWTDWDEHAQSLHGIARDTLEKEGEPHERVAARLVEALTGHDVFVTAPSWDGKWLSVLLRAAGLPRHAIRFRDMEEALYEAAAGRIRGAIPFPDAGPAIAGVLIQVRKAMADLPVEHRALPDAEAEFESWKLAGRLAGDARLAWEEAHVLH